MLTSSPKASPSNCSLVFDPVCAFVRLRLKLRGSVSEYMFTIYSTHHIFSI
ncbi:hypothetical protein HanIR_Chr13g0619401 [Helianthus annuus]|nr:hypothetical protein HanIR_Chr13g0619401 [Helianthus annuus]